MRLSNPFGVTPEETKAYVEMKQAFAPYGLRAERIPGLRQAMREGRVHFGPAPQVDTIKSFSNQELIDILKLEFCPERSIYEKAGKELDRRLTPAEASK